MSTSLTTNLSKFIPPTGSRSWWLLYVGGPVTVIVSALLMFPELVYEQFIWQYLWGPVVADANGEPITRYGVQVIEGYTPVNTVVYLGFVLYSLPGLQAFHDALSIDLTTRLAYSLAPIIVAGGAMRALADASLLGSLNVWFITPSIYVVIAGAALGSIAVGSALRDRGLFSVPATVGLVGAAWAVMALRWILLYGLTAVETFRPLVPVLTLSIASVVTGGFYLAGSVTGWSVLHHPMYLLVIFGQMWDAAQNLVGVTLYGYTPKMFFTQQLYRWTGFGGSTFAVKLLAVTLIVWILVNGENDLPQEQWWLIAMVIIVAGLPMGVRGTTRMMLGV